MTCRLHEHQLREHCIAFALSIHSKAWDKHAPMPNSSAVADFISGRQLPEAFVVLGFAFYLQPMMMPLLHDMPPGPAGLAITSTAVKIVIIGTLIGVMKIIWVKQLFSDTKSILSLHCQSQRTPLHPTLSPVHHAFVCCHELIIGTVALVLDACVCCL